MNTIFSKDLYRYYGDAGESLARRMLRPPELRYLALLRKASTCKRRLWRLLYTVRLKRLSYRTLIQIPVQTEIGNPAKIVRKENATKDYICNTV